MPTAFYWPEKGQQQQKREQRQLRLFHWFVVLVVVVRGSTYFLLIEKLIKGDKNYTCHRFSRWRRSPATAAAQQWQQWTRPAKTRFNYTHTHTCILSLSLFVSVCSPHTCLLRRCKCAHNLLTRTYRNRYYIFNRFGLFINFAYRVFRRIYNKLPPRLSLSLSLSPSFVQSNVAREGESAHQRVGGIECKCERDSARAQQGKLIKSSCINHGTYLVSLSLSLLRSFARIYPLTARRSRRRCCRRRRRRRQSQSLRLRDSDGKLIPW